MTASLCECGGYVDPDMSLHARDCRRLLETTNLYDSVPREVSAHWRDAGVPMYRCLTRGHVQPCWRGPRAVVVLWRASGMYYLPEKHIVPESLVTLVPMVLLDEQVSLVLEHLSMQPEPRGGLTVRSAIDAQHEEVLGILKEMRPKTTMVPLFLSSSEWIRRKYGKQHEYERLK
jgi:hypothetical protein